jgi:hypothetical protein
LFIKKYELEEKLQSEEAIAKIYPYPFKLVTHEEHVEAIKERRENVLFIENIGGNLAAIDIYSASEGRLIISTAGWLNYHYMNEKFFEKLP